MVCGCQRLLTDAAGQLRARGVGSGVHAPRNGVDEQSHHVLQPIDRSVAAGDDDAVDDVVAPAEPGEHNSKCGLDRGGGAEAVRGEGLLHAHAEAAAGAVLQAQRPLRLRGAGGCAAGDGCVPAGFERAGGLDAGVRRLRIHHLAPGAVEGFGIAAAQPAQIGCGARHRVEYGAVAVKDHRKAAHKLGQGPAVEDDVVVGEDQLHVVVCQRHRIGGEQSGLLEHERGAAGSRTQRVDPLLLCGGTQTAQIVDAQHRCRCCGGCMDDLMRFAQPLPVDRRAQGRHLAHELGCGLGDLISAEGCLQPVADLHEVLT